MSNDNPFVDPNSPQPMAQPPHHPPPQKSNTGLLIGCIILAAFIPLMGICAGLLLPAVQSAREAARRMSCSNNMKQIGLALHNYHAAYKTLPPAYTVDASGQPLHSWRTIILPFMEQQALYSQIDFSKPWDDPVNRAAAETVVPTYSCPSTRSTDPTMTTYVAVVDPAGIMTGPKATTFAQIRDGLANTIMIIEVDSAAAVHWMSPDDTDPATYMNAGSQRESGHIGGGHVLMADGAVIFVTDSMDSNLRKALLSKDGGEDIQENLGY